MTHTKCSKCGVSIPKKYGGAKCKTCSIEENLAMMKGPKHVKLKKIWWR